MLVAGGSPLPLAIASSAVAAAVALLGLLAGGRRALRPPAPATVLHLLLIGALGSGAVVLLGILAMTGTTATNRSLFQAMYPVATAVTARLLLREQLATGAWALIGVMAAGLVLMNSDAEGLVINRAFWMLAATLPLIGLSDVYARRTLAAIAPATVAAARLGFGAAFLLLALPFTPAGAWQGLGDQAIAVIGAGLAMAVGVLGLYRIMDRAGASRAAAFAALAPVVTAVAEAGLLGARFSALQLGGLALVVAAGIRLARVHTRSD